MTVDKWVVYSTFDSEGLADEPAVSQLIAYRDCGFRTLVVDTSPTLSVERRRDWERVATVWRQRDNVGYDFGSYKFGLDLLRAEKGVRTDRLDLLLTNDSCFGPFWPLADVIRRFDGLPDEPDVVYGITDSVQDGAHIQSYWLYFRAAACHHAATFLDGMAPAADREQAIAHGELALGAHLRTARCRRVVWCPWDETLAALALDGGRLPSTVALLVRRAFKRWKYNRDVDTQCLRWLLGWPSKMRYFNPVVLFGVEAFRAGRNPFVKKSMIRDNVYRAPEIPPGLQPRGMTNADVRRLLEPTRR